MQKDFQGKAIVTACAYGFLITCIASIKMATKNKSIKVFLEQYSSGGFNDRSSKE